MARNLICFVLMFLNASALAVQVLAFKIKQKDLSVHTIYRTSDYLHSVLQLPHTTYLRNYELFLI
jgi:hypothetical protein